MGLQDPLNAVTASCDQAGCGETLSAIPSAPVGTMEALTKLFADCGWQMTSAKKTYCPRHVQKVKK